MLAFLPWVMAWVVATPYGALAQDEAVRPDYLTLANGALPISWTTTAPKPPRSDAALAIVDGNPGGVSLVGPAVADTRTELIIALPAATTFERFAVPSVLETPSPSQTFTRRVEVYGAASDAEGPYSLLASGDLVTHDEAGQMSELEVHAATPVRFVKVRLIGGIEVLRDAMFFEFSEIIGNGRQEPVPLSERFDGVWKGRGVKLELQQSGPSVSGCYDTGGSLEGTVSGNVLRARGRDDNTGVESLFVLLVDDHGSVTGVRSTNGAPFRLYKGDAAGQGSPRRCSDRGEPALGCGSVIHGIGFDFDSAVLRDDAAPILAQLYQGLADEPARTISIEGHTSSEGSERYNRALSERRARAVVADLVARGLAADRFTAAGIGEARPIASNDDEAGRSLNRRVEVHCEADAGADGP